MNTATVKDVLSGLTTGASLGFVVVLAGLVFMDAVARNLYQDGGMGRTVLYIILAVLAVCMAMGAYVEVVTHGNL